MELGNFSQLLEKWTYALLNYKDLKKFIDKCRYYDKDDFYENGIQNPAESIA